jgi:hypothetical protein
MKLRSKQREKILFLFSEKVAEVSADAVEI